MKVLMICGSLYPAQTGGVDNSVYWQSKSLVENGIDVQIITTNTGIEKGQIKENVWMKTDAGLVKYVSIKDKHFPIEWIFETLKLLLKYKGILHFHSLTYSSPFLILVPFLRNKIIWTIHGDLEPYATSFGKIYLKKAVFFFYKLLRYKIVYHTTSDSETLNTKKILGNRTKIIQLSNYIELPKKNDSLKEKSEKYFIYMGRLHPIKALDNLIQALALSEKFKTSEFIFKIAGEGDTNYTKSLEEMVAKLGLVDKVKFIGFVKGKQKQELYGQAYFLFLISHTENFGNVVIESLAQGTPVVTSKGTPWEILEKENAGFWIDNSPIIIARTIDNILDMKIEDYKEQENNAQKLAQEQFDINKNVGKWIDLYTKILKNDGKKFS